MTPQTLTSRSEAEAASRRRHPSMRSGATVDQLEDRLADTLELTGVPHPDVAVALLSRRGRRGLDPETFAQRTGVSIHVLTAAEEGRLRRDELPMALRRLVPHPPRS